MLEMIRSFDLSLYLVAGPAGCRSFSLLDTVEQAVAGGVTIVQLRHPEGPTRVLVAEARALHAVLRPHGIPLIINDRVDVVLAAGADGVHLGQDDMRAVEARLILGPDRIIGLSVGSPEEVERSQEDLAAVDYVGIGPIRGTSTKADAGAAIGVEGFSRVLDLVRVPAVAIGGLGEGQAGALVRAGAAGVAVVSAICGSEHPEHAARALSDEIAAARA
jgi:thiamine-phosphate pyrophosphorylase